MRIYLDICCYNRQFDEKFFENDLVEFKSVIQLRKEIIQKNVELVTSFMLHYENYRKKNLKKRDNIDLFIKMHRKIYVGVDAIEELKVFVEKFVASGIKQKDAYHLASAIFAGCDYFLTFDKKLLKFTCEEIKILSPVDFMEVYENGNRNGR